VAAAAMEEGLARVERGWDEVYQQAAADIAAARALVEDMKKLGYIREPPLELLREVLRDTLEAL
jgi:malate dehydrogenase (oxaloacetate-decarboxylating)